MGPRSKHRFWTLRSEDQRSRSVGTMEETPIDPRLCPYCATEADARGASPRTPALDSNDLRLDVLPRGCRAAGRLRSLPDILKPLSRHVGMVGRVDSL
jgi:hypothetical protein